MSLINAILPAAHAAGTATATTGAAHPGGNPFGSFIFLALIILVFYFLLWRPQSKRAKQHRDLINNLKVDDEVVTTGGILARVHKINDNFLIVELADGVKVHLQKNAISAVMPKGTLGAV